MSRVTTFIYGTLIVLVALDAMIFGFVPSIALPLAVIVLGALVLFTPILRPGPGGSILLKRTLSNWLRRWVFGAVMVLMGIASTGIVPSLSGSNYTALGYLTLDTFIGQLILLIIGAIYFLAAFARTRQINVASF